MLSKERFPHSTASASFVLLSALNRDLGKELHSRLQHCTWMLLQLALPKARTVAKAIFGAVLGPAVPCSANVRVADGQWHSHCLTEAGLHSKAASMKPHTCGVKINFLSSNIVHRKVCISASNPLSLRSSGVGRSSLATGHLVVVPDVPIGNDRSIVQRAKWKMIKVLDSSSRLKEVMQAGCELTDVIQTAASQTMWCTHWHAVHALYLSQSEVIHIHSYCYNCLIWM